MASITEVEREEEVQKDLSNSSNNFGFLNPIEAAKAAIEEANTSTAKKNLDPNLIQRLSDEVSSTDEKIKSLRKELLQSGENPSEKKGSIFELAASSDEIASVNKDPNLALEALLAALAAEKANIEKIRLMDEEALQKVDLIDQLLDLNASLKVPEGKDRLEVTREIREKIDSLKEKGIDLKIPDTISGKTLPDIKSSIQARIDQLNQKIRTQFTKIQTQLQLINSILEAAKQILRDTRQGNQTSIRNQKGQG